MYTEKDLILHAKNYIDNLSNGINPLDNSKICDNNIIKNKKIVTCFQYVSKWLSQLAEEIEIRECALPPIEELTYTSSKSFNLDTETNKKSCNSCKYYKNNTCSGFGPVCDDYEQVRVFTDNETSSWPKMGNATYYKFKKNRKQL